MTVRAILSSGLLSAALILPAVAHAEGSRVARTDVNMRSGPGISYESLAVVPAGARVNVHECGGWCRVTYAGRTGWISASYVGNGGSASRSRGGTDLDLPNAPNPFWDHDWDYYRYPYGNWYTNPGGYWWTSPGVIFRF